MSSAVFVARAGPGDKPVGRRHMITIWVLLAALLPAEATLGEEPTGPAPDERDDERRDEATETEGPLDAGRAPDDRGVEALKEPVGAARPAGQPSPSATDQDPDRASGYGWVPGAASAAAGLIFVAASAAALGGGYAIGGLRHGGTGKPLPSAHLAVAAGQLTLYVVGVAAFGLGAALLATATATTLGGLWLADRGDEQ